MMKLPRFLTLTAILTVLLLPLEPAFGQGGCCQDPNMPDTTSTSLAYLGQTPPGLVPQKFAPGLISKEGRYEFGCTFSADAKEFYFGVETGPRALIYGTRVVNGNWTPIEALYPDATFTHNDPMLNNAEDRLYFISKLALSGTGSKDDHDIWYAERQGNGWSAPINAGRAINSADNDYYISFAANGNLYYASKVPNTPQYNYDIQYSPYKNGRYKKPVKLPQGAINTDRYEADVFIAPDESYMIFCAVRREGLGQGDMYISFKDANGNWGQSVNMGAPFNTEGHELCPFVSKDGKYLFYTSNQDIYWVSTAVLDNYK